MPPLSAVGIAFLQVGEDVNEMKALRGDAQLLRYLDFLIYGEVNATALYGPGIPINVPAPERYAVHKLIISQLRSQTHQSQTKARKDIRQAEALIEVLLEDRPFELLEVWQEALNRGPKWRDTLRRGEERLNEDLRSGLSSLMRDDTPGP